MKTLKTQTANALSYCQNLLSFIFQHKEAADKIATIYLFGSAVRGELHKNSDIDLFITCKAKDEQRVKNLTESAILRFTFSLDYKKWKLLKCTYPFSIQYGNLEEWDLKLSIASEGLVLYSETSLPQGERYVLFTLTYPPQKNKYIALRRLLFGRDEEQYIQGGTIHKLRGKKISSHAFLLPKEEQTTLIDLLSKHEITFSMKEIMLLES